MLKTWLFGEPPGNPVRTNAFVVVAISGTTVFAEFETNLRRERQLEGINAAKARGVYKGRKPSIDAGEVLRLRREEKLGPAVIARRLGIGRASVYRLLGKHYGTVAADGGGNADQA